MANPLGSEDGEVAVDQSLMDDSTFMAYASIRFYHQFAHFACSRGSRWEHIWNSLLKRFNRYNPDNLTADEELEIMTLLCKGAGIDAVRYIKLFTKLANDVQAGIVAGIKP